MQNKRGPVRRCLKQAAYCVPSALGNNPRSAKDSRNFLETSGEPIVRNYCKLGADLFKQGDEAHDKVMRLMTLVLVRK